MAVRIVNGTEVGKEVVGDDYFFELIVSVFGKDYIQCSCLGELDHYIPGAKTYEIRSAETRLRRFIKDKPIKTALEIGTFNGVSTAVLAHYAEKVLTVDNNVNAMIHVLPVWYYTGVLPKIEFYIADDNADKAQLIKDFDFDYAFVDADHRLEGVKFDFELVKRCGRVLFHDYYDRPDARWPDIKTFVDGLPAKEVTIDEPFAYWERNGF